MIIDHGVVDRTNGGGGRWFVFLLVGDVVVDVDVDDDTVVLTEVEAWDVPMPSSISSFVVIFLAVFFRSVLLLILLVRWISQMIISPCDVHAMRYTGLFHRPGLSGL